MTYLVKGLNPGVGSHLQSVIFNRLILKYQSSIGSHLQSLKMTTAQVVETSVTVNNNSPTQDYVHLDDQTQPTFDNLSYS